MNALKISISAAALSALGAAQALAQTSAQTGEGYGYHHPHMWGGHGYGLVTVIVILAAVALLGFGAMRCCGHRCRRRRGASDALAILEERFARGEIDAQEFEERRKALRGD